MKSKVISRWLMYAVGCLIVTESATRLSGITDFPIYDIDNEIGYIPKPNQSGSFLHRNAWIFNEKSMGTSAWAPDRHPNLLLIGNSIVYGGNPYDQPQKLGPQIEAKLGGRYLIWPIAAGGWTNINEVAYFERNPDVAEHADFFAWEVMKGGFGELSKWRGDSIFPRDHPRFAVVYVFNRYIRPRLFNAPASELPPVSRAATEQVARFEKSIAALAKGPGHGAIWLFPTRSDYRAAKDGSEWLEERVELQRICAKFDLALIDIAADPRWDERFYRDDGVHPTAEGNEILAEIIVSHFRRLMFAGEAR